MRLCASSQATLKRQQGTQYPAVVCPSEPVESIALSPHASCLPFLGAMAHNLTYSRVPTSSDKAVMILCAHKALGQGKDERSRMAPCPAWRAWSAEPSHAHSSSESVPTTSRRTKLFKNASVGRQALPVEGHQPEAMMYVHRPESGEHI